MTSQPFPNDEVPEWIIKACDKAMARFERDKEIVAIIIDAMAVPLFEDDVVIANPEFVGFGPVTDKIFDEVFTKVGRTILERLRDEGVME